MRFLYFDELARYLIGWPSKERFIRRLCSKCYEADPAGKPIEILEAADRAANAMQKENSSDLGKAAGILSMLSGAQSWTNNTGEDIEQMNKRIMREMITKQVPNCPA